tara:strand:+ start:2524 stop:3621 length:1098 start_codon:yes stop_codon:yes gene_type:complete
MKLAILGKGTAGALALNHFNSYTDYEIDVYYDSSIKEQTVGEGTTLHIPTRLNYTLGMNWEDVRNLNGTVKTGIYYDGWSTNNYFHSFYLPSASIHIDAVKLQNYLLDKNILERNKCNLIDKNVNANEVDADYVIDCTGKPNDYSNYVLTNNINVNAVCVSQYKPIKSLDHTLCTAMKNGWMFGIPLQDRISFGYLYNADISTKDVIKKEMKTHLRKREYVNELYTNSFNFKNYYHQQNFVENVAHNGNASFFLEPLEATSLALVDRINRWTYEILNNTITQEQANYYYEQYVKQIEIVIGLHYLNPVIKSKFWEYAKNNSQYITKDSSFIDIINNLANDNFIFDDYGTWNKDSFKQNLRGLNIL